MTTAAERAAEACDAGSGSDGTGAGSGPGRGADTDRTGSGHGSDTATAHSSGRDTDRSAGSGDGSRDFDAGGGRDGGGTQASAFLVPLFTDLVAPLAVYYLAQAWGVGTSAAILFAGLSTLPRQLVQFTRRRRLDGLGIAILAAFVLGALLTLYTGDVRLMAVKDAIWPLAAGLVTAGSCVRGKPVSFYVFRPLLTQGQAENRPLWNEVWAAGPAFRRALRTLAAVWAAILLTVAVAVVVLSLRLPVNQAAAVPGIAQLVGVPLLLGFTALYGKHTGLGIRVSLAAMRSEDPDARRRL